MSLKYLTIIECLYSMSESEKTSLVNEIIEQVSGKTLKELHNNILDISYRNKTILIVDFQDIITKISGILDIDRDWTINYPTCETLYIKWNTIYDDSDGTKYRFLMCFNQDSVKIKKVYNCSCFSPRFCSGCLGSKKNESTDSIIFDNHSNENTETWISEWVENVLKKYEKLLSNYHLIKVDYFINEMKTYNTIIR